MLESDIVLVCSRLSKYGDELGFLQIDLAPTLILAGDNSSHCRCFLRTSCVSVCLAESEMLVIAYFISFKTNARDNEHCSRSCGSQHS